MIWTQVKGYIAANNKKFNLTEIMALTKEGLDRVTGSEWKKVVDHTKKTIDAAWEKEGLVEEAVERLVIEVNDSDSDSDDSDGNDCVDEAGPDSIQEGEIYYELEVDTSDKFHDSEIFPFLHQNEKQ